MISKKISHYKILDKIGEGGMGEIYLAEDTKLKRKVALKFISAELTKNKSATKRFEQEAQAAASLNHPNIVTIHEIGEFEDPATEDKRTFISMEYVEGESLREKMKVSSLLSIENVIDITTQICEGLSKAHKAGIIHRDIKPENILIDEDGRVKILDFGLATLKRSSKDMGDESTSGTVCYMSPEQAQGLAVNHQTDIWSLGVVLYEMLAGKRPFEGEFDQVVTYSIVNEEPDSIARIRQDIPNDLNQIVSRAISKKLSIRYRRTNELCNELKKLQSNHSTSAKNLLQRSKSILTKKTVPIIIVAIAFMILSIVGLFLFPQFKNQPKPTDRKNKFVIAVIPFWGIDNEARIEGKLMQTLISKELYIVVEEEDDVEINTVNLDNVPRSRKKVRELGDSLCMNLVVWGEVLKLREEIQITSHITGIGNNNFHHSTNPFQTSLTASNQLVVRTSIAEQAIDLALLAIANYYRSASDYDRALELHEKIKSKTPLLYYSHASVLLNLSRLDIAKEIITEGLEKFPNESHLVDMLVEVYRASREYDQAIKYLDKAIENDPKNTDYYSQLYRIYSSLERHLESIKVLNKVIEIDPYNTTWLSELGILHKHVGNYDKALDAYVKAIKLDPNNSRLYTLLGDLYNKYKHSDKALALFQKAVDSGLNDSWSHIKLANFYDEHGQLDKALREYFIAIENEPDNPNNYFRLARYYEKHRQYNKAIKEFMNAINNSKPGYQREQMYIELADLYNNRHKYKKAIAIYQKVIKLSGWDSTERKMNIYWLLGQAYMNDNQFEDAIAEFKNVLALDPKNVDLMRTLGCIYRNNGDYDEAITCFKKAIEHGFSSNSKSYSYNAMGWAFYWMDMFDLAAKNMIKAVKLNPISDWGGFNLDLSIVLVRCGLVDSAYQHFLIPIKSLERDHPRAHIIRFFMGEFPEEELINEMPSNIWKGEAYYFLGVAYLLNFGKALSHTAPDTSKAKEYFGKSMESGNHTRRLLARTELRRLNEIGK